MKETELIRLVQDWQNKETESTNILMGILVYLNSK